jgi:hypothetical protein
MKKITRLIAMLLCAMLPFGCVACGKEDGGSGTIQISYWNEVEPWFESFLPYKDNSQQLA